MIICSCNVLTDHDVRGVIDLGSPPRTAAVYICLGGSARCGRCAGLSGGRVGSLIRRGASEQLGEIRKFRSGDVGDSPIGDAVFGPLDDVVAFDRA